MNNQYLTMAIAKLLQGLEKHEAMTVLTEAKLSLNFDKSPLPELKQCANTYRRGRPNKITKDPEVEAFILSLPYMEQKEILARVEAKFGAARTPSRAGLSRYLMMKRKAV
ncbi:hypothetical protein [Shewanella sp. Isolate7]|uniref:hypothetical protein n=1 Tax=Shewanella sp. Isolate7 TaxID=2908528 RepID=UPI001EFDE398|nr:hypothetical protein [Shewanella sp. Isolate7]MCG9722678.1 hypothetical protein [Shewanella sp. Isolate7]